MSETKSQKLTTLDEAVSEHEKVATPPQVNTNKSDQGASPKSAAQEKPNIDLGLLDSLNVDRRNSEPQFDHHNASEMVDSKEDKNSMQT